MLARDWRAGELRVLALALVIAVAAITSVAFFADRVGAGPGARRAPAPRRRPGAGRRPAVAARGRRRRSSAPACSARRGDQLHQHGVGAGESRSAGVKAVTENYPLRGRLRIAKAPGQPDAPAERGPAPGTVWLEERLVTALNAPVGSRIKLGRAEFEVAAVLTLEPERSTNFFNIAPRLMMNIADVPATALIQTGSRVWYYLYAAGPAEQHAIGSKNR